MTNTYEFRGALIQYTVQLVSSVSATQSLYQKSGCIDSTPASCGSTSSQNQPWLWESCQVSYLLQIYIYIYTNPYIYTYILLYIYIYTIIQYYTYIVIHRWLVQILHDLHLAMCWKPLCWWPAWWGRWPGSSRATVTMDYGIPNNIYIYLLVYKYRVINNNTNDNNNNKNNTI